MGSTDTYGRTSSFCSPRRDAASTARARANQRQSRLCRRQFSSRTGSPLTTAYQLFNAFVKVFVAPNLCYEKDFGALVHYLVIMFTKKEIFAQALSVFKERYLNTTVLLLQDLKFAFCLPTKASSRNTVAGLPVSELKCLETKLIFRNQIPIISWKPPCSRHLR